LQYHFSDVRIFKLGRGAQIFGRKLFTMTISVYSIRKIQMLTFAKWYCENTFFQKYFVFKYF